MLAPGRPPIRVTPDLIAPYEKRATDSKSSEGNLVWVRVPPPVLAPAARRDPARAGQVRLAEYPSSTAGHEARDDVLRVRRRGVRSCERDTCPNFRRETHRGARVVSLRLPAAMEAGLRACLADHP